MLKYLAWPTVVLVVLVTALFLFRDPIGRLIDRSDSVKTDLITIGKEMDARQFQNSTETTNVNQMRGNLAASSDLKIVNAFPDIDTISIQSAKDMILPMVLESSSTDKEIIENLLQFAAGNYATSTYSTTFMRLRFSHLRALAFLQYQESPVPVSELFAFYASGKDFAASTTTDSQTYPSFDDWLGELVKSMCIQNDNGNVSLAFIGKSMLTWAQRAGMSEYRRF